MPGMQEAVSAAKLCTGTAVLLRDDERRTFNYFWQETRADNGLAPDRVPWDEPFASIAAVGFALTAYPLGVERGWISRDQARQRTLATLRTLPAMRHKAAARRA